MTDAVYLNRKAFHIAEVDCKDPRKKMAPRSGTSKPKGKEPQASSTRSAQPISQNPNNQQAPVSEGSNSTRAFSPAGRSSTAGSPQRSRNKSVQKIVFAKPIEPNERMQATVEENAGRIDNIERQLDDLSVMIAARRVRRSKKPKTAPNRK